MNAISLLLFFTKINEVAIISQFYQSDRMGKDKDPCFSVRVKGASEIHLKVPSTTAIETSFMELISSAGP